MHRAPRVSRRSFLCAAGAASGAVLMAPAEQMQRLLAAPAAAGKSERRHEQLIARRDELRAGFATKVLALADERQAAGRTSDAERIRTLSEPAAADVDALPAHRLPEIPRSLPDDDRLWRISLRSLQESYADDLFNLAKESLQNQSYSLSYDLVREAAFHNPDHPRARALLGFIELQQEWMTPFRAKMLEAGKVFSPRFGWLPAKHLPRYEAGERYVDGRWMSAEREAGLRADFQRGWVAASDHFDVQTNHSLERGVELCRSLETFHAFFVRTMAPFFTSPQQMQKLFAGGLQGRPQPGPRHRVHYFRTQQEFFLELQMRQPEAAISNGIYMPVDRVSYFFDRPDAPEDVAETLYHETTHQLLGESVKRYIQVGVDRDFWLVEGIACYMESFRPEGPPPIIGDPRHLRQVWARTFRIEQKRYVPLSEFTSLPMLEFQRGGGVEQLKWFYAQAAGLTHFFMHYRDGVYRDALMTQLSQIYSPDARVRRGAATLAELTETPFDELDRQYGEHLEQLAAQ